MNNDAWVKTTIDNSGDIDSAILNATEIELWNKVWEISTLLLRLNFPISEAMDKELENV